MTTPGRPVVGPVIQVRIPDEDLDFVNRHAAATSTPRAELIRTAVREWIATHPEDQT